MVLFINPGEVEVLQKALARYSTNSHTDSRDREIAKTLFYRVEYRLSKIPPKKQLSSLYGRMDEKDGHRKAIDPEQLG